VVTYRAGPTLAWAEAARQGCDGPPSWKEPRRQMSLVSLTVGTEAEPSRDKALQGYPRPVVRALVVLRSRTTML
jgi:hypothetical protein